MQERHRNREQYFVEQGITTRKFVIPYIEEIRPVTEHDRILEIGCGEGGNLIPFLDRGCKTIGVDIDERKLKHARRLLGEFLATERAELWKEDIYDLDESRIGRFDVIVLRDVIEHIEDQERFLAHMKRFLAPEGLVFFGFPPWRMPFGGHQQICESRFLSHFPYFHLLPGRIYRGILKLFSEDEETIEELLGIKRTGISIKRFERIVRKNRYTISKKTLYLLNPNYETKFGLKPREQLSLIKSLPILRDFVTTCYYCLVQKKTFPRK